MSIAGVRLDDGRLVWVDAGELELQPLDQVVVEFDGREYQGQVMIAPEALIRPVQPTGRIAGISPRDSADTDCSDLPGADMPPLGTRVAGEIVMAVDAVKRTITVEGTDGTRSTRNQPGNS